MGGTAPYTYAWSNGATAQTGTALPGGMNSVTVTDANGCTCTHDTLLVEPSMISDFVWEDEDGDGIQGATEVGLEGVSITLSGTDFMGESINFATTSDADGAYKFDQLPMGNYFLIFQLQGFQDYLHSPINQGGDSTLDSDMDPVTGSINRQVTAHGIGDFDTDAGYIPQESVIVISDRAWYDENHDGVQNPFETSIQGVTVRLTRQSANIVVSASSVDIDNVDMGLHENCGEVDTSGVIEGNESVCRGDVPTLITSLIAPTGSTEYQWIRSSSSTYRGPNDPNWLEINGARSVNYQPSSLVETVHYIRLSRVSGCVDFTGASNVITKTINPLPNAEITSGATTFCMSQTLSVSADSTMSVVIEWDFGADATPQFATGRVVNDVSFSTTGPRFIHLAVTSADGCVGRDSLQINTLNCFGPGDMGSTTGRSRSGTNTIEWNAISLVQGSYFDIERMLDGADYEVISSIDAKGLAEWFDYSYEDKFAPTGDVSYRIVHRAPATSDARSSEVLLSVEQVALMTKVYPNPVGDLLTVELATAELGNVEYEIINSYGTVILSGTYEAGRHELNTSSLPPGTYYLRAIAQDGTAEVRALVKH